MQRHWLLSSFKFKMFALVILEHVNSHQKDTQDVSNNRTPIIYQRFKPFNKFKLESQLLIRNGELNDLISSLNNKHYLKLKLELKCSSINVFLLRLAE